MTFNVNSNVYFLNTNDKAAKYFSNTMNIGIQKI